MTSIFDLYESTNQLPKANQGITNYFYDQVSSQRGTITDQNFAGGVHQFKWNINTNQWYVPQRSYYRIRAKLTVPAGTQLAVNNGVAPSMNLAPSLFQSGKFKVNDQEISDIPDFFAEIDTLETRMSKSKAWLDSIGATINWWEPDFSKRVADVSSNGNLDEWEVISGTNLTGVTPLTQIAVAVDTGIATFTVAVPDVRLIFQAGDQIEIDVGGAAIGTVRYVISNLIAASGDTIQLNQLKGIAIVAGAYPFRIYRRKQARRDLGFEMIWNPAFSVNKLSHALPNGKYEIQLVPFSSATYKKRAIQALSDLSGGTAGTDGFNFTIDSIYYYVATMTSKRFTDGTYALDLDRTECALRAIGGASASQQNIEVSPSTYAITVAFRSVNAGTNTVYPATMFKSINDDDLKLNRLQVNYADQSKPIPTADPEYPIAGLAGSTNNYIIQLYNNSMMYTGRYFAEGGCESFDDWKARGAYYFLPFPKDGDDTSTTVTIRYGFQDGGTTPFTANGTEMLVFYHYKRSASITMKNGNIVDIIVRDE